MTLMTRCRTCRAPDPYLFLPLGDHPPANMFLRKEELAGPQPAFALDTQACLACGLIMVEDQIPADFFTNYLYVPSGAATMHRHFGELAQVLRQQAGDELIVDIGCNDGLLLSACNLAGSRTLGIDPAANLAEAARSRGVDVHVDYFGPQTARSVSERHGTARVIVTTNTFNHVGDLHDFMEAILILLAGDGTFVIEVPWARELLARNEFDTVYHEHVSEFSLLSIVRLGEAFGLDVVDVHRLKVHGGSMRVFLRRASLGQRRSSAVTKMLAEEADAGMLRKETYEAFAQRIHAIQHDLVAMLHDLKAKGLKVAGYGAPAKGNTLLNFCGIDGSLVEFLVDKNPLKQGLYSPGMKIPIRGPEAIEEEGVDVLLVLAWNFFDEIREQQGHFEQRGGRFLVPLPTPSVV